MPDSFTLDSSYIICGYTEDHQTFRPSDWAERLCGVMSCFAPDPRVSQAHIKYTQYVYPTRHNEKKAVYVDAALRELEPLAFRFFLQFARDNHLVVVPATPEEKMSSPISDQASNQSLD